jgi:penicillin-insensitive murein DD-endopeptidase
MNIRVVLVLAVMLAVSGGVLVLARSDAQAPSSAATLVPATTPSQADKPAAAAPPAKAETPAASETPAVAKPKEEPTPAASASPPAQEKPAAAKAPEQKPAPVVAEPRQESAPQPEKPAAAHADKKTTDKAKSDEAKTDETKADETKADEAKKPTPEQPAPVAATPSPAPTEQSEKPAAAAKPSQAPAPTETPTPVVTAPTPKPEMKPEPKPAIVMTPLPEKRPNITRALIERTEPAKELFGAAKLPSAGKSRVIGYYTKGCLAGAVELPPDGPHWQAMRLSRNRNWGHPELVRFIKRVSADTAKATGWHGILIGDMAQPRGGPLPFGHRSHQVGLDVDIWYTPMPDHILTRKERETMSATRMVAANGLSVNKNFTIADAKFLRAVAEEPVVERVLVNAAIKEKMCALEGKHHYAWMAKLRPWYGHTSHIHVRLKCPAGSPHCRHQPPVPRGDGCSKKALAYWFSDRVLHPKPAKHHKPRKQIMLANLPHACKTVLNAPAKKKQLAAEAR